MKKQKSLDTELKLQAWFDGQIGDHDLSKKDVKDLERRIFKAIAAKTLQRNDVHTFADHQTLQ